MMAGARLTDQQKQKIIADYVQCGSFNATAKANGVCDKTVKALVIKDPELRRKFEEKNTRNSEDIIRHMETKKGKVIDIIDKYLDALLDPNVIAKSSASQLTTALGTVIDKFTMIRTETGDESGAIDALSKALFEEAEKMNNADQQ